MSVVVSTSGMMLKAFGLGSFYFVLLSHGWCVSACIICVCVLHITRVCVATRIMYVSFPLLFLTTFDVCKNSTRVSIHDFVCVFCSRVFYGPTTCPRYGMCVFRKNDFVCTCYVSAVIESREILIL